MAIEGFDYQNFAQVLASQVGELLPADFSQEQKNYVTNTVMNFSLLAGEALYKDNDLKFNADQAMLVTQLIAEWSFHKSVDLIRAQLPAEHWDAIMQKIAFTIFEIAKQSIQQGMQQDQILQIVEEQVRKTYSEMLNELKQNNIINDELLDKASSISNIDEMMSKIQEEKMNAQASGQNPDYKILKLASVAIVLKQISQGRALKILNKFSPEDAKAIMQYMEMPDLEDKVDKQIAVKCFEEIKTILPEPKTVNPNKILNRLRSVIVQKDRVRTEILLRKERPQVRQLVKTAMEGGFLEVPARVVNVVSDYIEENK
ncbi:MAG TPA: hypothetical protein PLG15_00785 [Candidatus Gastranaerophilaceae bacterium]|nr:hypothetical protein [Candidatus Gastranaerophilaceae bacterium]HPT40903.1 hypothetical protein [Candidatus Gastranaerophilaceae bacterium]